VAGAVTIVVTEKCPNHFWSQTQSVNASFTNLRVFLTNIKTILLELF